MFIISLELKRVNPDQNIFSKNVELTPILFTQGGLEHHQHQILNRIDEVININIIIPIAVAYTNPNPTP